MGCEVFVRGIWGVGVGNFRCWIPMEKRNVDFSWWCLRRGYQRKEELRRIIGGFEVLDTNGKEKRRKKLADLA